MGKLIFEDVDEFDIDVILTSLNHEISKTITKNLDILANSDMSNDEKKSYIAHNDRYIEWVKKIQTKHTYHK